MKIINLKYLTKIFRRYSINSFLIFLVNKFHLFSRMLTIAFEVRIIV